MGDAATSYLLQQLAYQAPVLLVYLIGLILALVFLRRHRAASLLTLLGTGWLILVTLLVALVQAYLRQLRLDDMVPDQSYAQLMSVVGITGHICRAVGVALIVAAVFVGRRPPMPIDLESL